jgi:hypothetical protein
MTGLILWRAVAAPSTLLKLYTGDDEMTRQASSRHAISSTMMLMIMLVIE